MAFLLRSALFLSSLLFVHIIAGPAISQSIDTLAAARTPAAIPRIAAAETPAVTKNLIDDYRAEVRKFPDDALLHNNLGVELAKIKEFVPAAASLENAVRLDPNSAPLLINLGLVYSSLGRNTEAWAVLDRAVAISPENTRARTALCDQIAHGNDHRRTIACYTELKKHGELDAVSSFNFATAVDGDGDPGAAVRILDDAATRYRNSAWIYNGIGMLRYKNKQFRKAATAFKSAVELDPARGELRLNLAIAQIAMRNRAGALSQYNLLKTSDPKFAVELYKLLFRDKVVYVGEVR